MQKLSRNTSITNQKHIDNGHKTPISHLQTFFQLPTKTSQLAIRRVHRPKSGNNHSQWFWNRFWFIKQFWFELNVNASTTRYTLYLQMRENIFPTHQKCIKNRTPHKKSHICRHAISRAHIVPSTVLYPPATTHNWNCAL